MSEPDDLAAIGGQLVQEVRGLSRRFRVLRHLVAGLAVSFAVDLTITVVLATVVSNQQDINHRLRQALTQDYTTSQQQQQVRTENLCPLYQLLIGFADNPVRPPNETLQQREDTARASAALHKQYDLLKCPAPGSNP